MIDVIARRYNKLPTDILHLKLDDFQFNLLCLQVGIEKENKDAQKNMKRGRR